jgi:hypothetical protein
VFIRLAALSESTGTGSRDTIAIDNFGLSFTPVPEPEDYGLITAIALLGWVGWRGRRRSTVDGWSQVEPSSALTLMAKEGNP